VVGGASTESFLSNCTSAGTFAFLIKPVQAETLYQLLPDRSGELIEHPIQPPIHNQEAPAQTP
jgi:hypothetical protein